MFHTKDYTNTDVTILAEKERLAGCRPFKQFILKDSVQRTTVLKSGSKKAIVGLNLSTIDGIKIRDEGELVKIIWNCECFTAK